MSGGLCLLPSPWLLTVWLAQGMEDMQVHGPVQGADEQCLVGARGLVCVVAAP